MNSLIYVDAYYMSNLKKKKKKGEKTIFPHCKCPCQWSAWCTTSQFVTDFAWTKNLVENLRLTTKKGLFSTNIPRNYHLSMIPNLFGFVRKMEKKKKNPAGIQPAHSSTPSSDSHMIILSSFAFPHKQKLSSSSSSSSYVSKTSKLSSDLLKLTICRRRPKNLYRKPPHFWMISRFAFLVNRNVNDVLNLASRDNQLTSINKYHSSLIDYNQHCTKETSLVLSPSIYISMGVHYNPKLTYLLCVWIWCWCVLLTQHHHFEWLVA